MRYGANGEAINVAGEKVFTQRDAIEVALSAALADVNIRLSDNMWDRLCKNATSEVTRQLRKVTTMGKPELTGSLVDQQVQIGVMLLQQNDTMIELLRRLVDGDTAGKQKKGANNG